MPLTDPGEDPVQVSTSTLPSSSSAGLLGKSKRASHLNVSLDSNGSASEDSIASSIDARPKLRSSSSSKSRHSGRKKFSLSSNPVPIFCFGGSSEQEEDSDAVQRLESAVRKMSRSSPSRSPNRQPTALRLGGLVGLARGYEQYRESLRYLTPTVEYGEASSDDLSSEWESSEVEGNNNRSFRPARRIVSLPPGSIQDDTTNYLSVPTSDTEARPGGGGSGESSDEMLSLRTSPSSTPQSKAKSGPRGNFMRPSGWRKLRSMVQWTPFIQTYKHKRYQWVQLAGHSGNFKAGKSQGTVLKKLCAQEEVCYRKLDNDAMVQFVPKYQGVLTLDDDEKFIQLQDCLSSFTNPSIMDCKIGVRTYLEEELAKAKEKPKLRRDMYDKMIAVDSSAPTEEEHKLKGVTKPRYMVWRETISSTATLGFRIEGVKMSDGSSSKDFKTTKTKDQVFEAFQKFLSFSPDKAVQYLERLRVIRSSLEGSKFFHEHELIGSSLLFVHDSKKASIWLIDFGKTVPLPSGVVIDHKSPWEVGNHEDGYLIGIDNLVNIMAQVVSLDRSKPEDTSVSSRHSSSSSTRPKSVTKPPVSSSS